MRSYQHFLKYIRLTLLFVGEFSVEILDPPENVSETFDEQNVTSWWFQPIWKILVNLDHFPKWNHHLGEISPYKTQGEGGLRIAEGRDSMVVFFLEGKTHKFQAKNHLSWTSG